MDTVHATVPDCALYCRKLERSTDFSRISGSTIRVYS